MKGNLRRYDERNKRSPERKVVQGLQAWWFLFLLKELDTCRQKLCFLKTFESWSIVGLDLTLAAAAAGVWRGGEAVKPERGILDYILEGLKSWKPVTSLTPTPGITFSIEIRFAPIAKLAWWSNASFWAPFPSIQCSWNIAFCTVHCTQWLICDICWGVRCGLL